MHVPTAHDVVSAALALLDEALSRTSGSPLVLTDDPAARLRLHLVAEDALEGPDGYILEIDPTQLTLAAASAAGFLHGVQTIRQLLPAVGASPQVPVTLPCLRIDDAPRFGWRGLHVDVARHLFPVPALERLIDTMALFKLNRLHWHLTDDQGWRLELPSLPRLTEVGAWRSESPRRGARTEGDGEPYGGFYTQAEVRALVAYARARGIEVVPEIDVPGHVQAVLAAYPEMGHGPAPDVWTRWGISTRVLNTSDETLRFLDQVFGDVADLFPASFVHVGGDEVPTEEWQASEAAQARVEEAGLESIDRLPGWFLRHVAQGLARKGRRSLAWDEALEQDPPPETAIMVWRDAAFAHQAARRGHDVVCCPMSCCYFDHYQAAPETEPEAIGGLTTWRDVLAYEPIGEDWSTHEQARVLGVQGNLWSEYIHDAAHLEYMAWPRAGALAEVAWSPRGARDADAFASRWRGVAARLDALGVAHRRIDE